MLLLGLGLEGSRFSVIPSSSSKRQGSTLLLDDYTDAAAAYSVRRISSSSTTLMRVREAAGGREADIGYDTNGMLDSAAIAAHCGTADGFVVSWTDQSGNGNHATQSTAGRQPKIYDGTTQAVITDNGKPALDFLLNDNRIFQEVTGLTFNTNDVGVFVVCTAITGHNAYATALNIAPGAGTQIAIAYRTEQISYAGTTLGTGTSDTTQNLVSLYADNASNDVRGYIDGTQLGTTSTSSNAGTSFTIASLGGIGSAYWEGTIQEIVFYPSSTKSSHTAIETNINSEYLIYQPTDTPTSGLLATYSGAAAAYSVRQLADTALISITVRRDSDDEEKRFGFDSNGDLDTTGIADFCTTANGYVSQWWDQSTNGNHATQSTGSAQPQIYNGTAVITENGKPGVEFTTFDNLTFTSTDIYSFFIVSRPTSIITGSANFAVGLTTSLKGIAVAGDSGSRQARAYSNTGTLNMTGIGVSNNQSLVDYVTTGTNGKLRYNAANELVGSATEITVDQLGSCQSLNYRVLNGPLQEIVMYASDQDSNRTGIETNINGYFSIY